MKIDFKKLFINFGITIAMHTTSRQNNRKVTCPLKGTGHFFETLSVGSVPGTDHS